MERADEHAPVRSVARAVDLLIALGRGPMRLGDISVEVGLSKPTTHRILYSLKSKGMVIQDSLSGDYGLGPACFHLMSSLVNGKAGFPLDAKPILEDLRNYTMETVAVHVRAGLSRICIQEYPSPHAIRYTAGLGATAGIHVGSAGKVLLAFMPVQEREHLLADLRPTAMTEDTITDLGRLRTELEKVTAQGFAVSHGERVSGAAGVSAPVLDSHNRALVSISVLGPADRLESILDDARKHLCAAADAISVYMQKSLDN